jgi:hypothetical protein
VPTECGQIKKTKSGNKLLHIKFQYFPIEQKCVQFG